MKLKKNVSILKYFVSVVYCENTVGGPLWGHGVTQCEQVLGSTQGILLYCKYVKVFSLDQLNNANDMFIIRFVIFPIETMDNQ